MNKMKCVSKIFQPIITIPKNAKVKNTEITCKSQKLLLELGMIRPTSSGFFALLPFARRALDKLEALVCHHIEAAGAQRVSLPALTAANLWKKSGRLEEIGPELMTLSDRHDHKYLLAPTHEEAITDLLADVGPLSYKQLPLLLYQINEKHRDESRPKHGLMRARGFAMMDAYGAHQDGDCAEGLYKRVGLQYRRLFRRLGLPVRRVEAPSGAMGGSLSHEWQLPAPSGEDAIDVCPSCSHAAIARPDGTAPCVRCGRETGRLSSVEVGHTFVLGTRYSAPLGAHFVPATGGQLPLVMSCYGIGITRLLAASLEVLSSDTSLRWPRAIAPYSAIVIGPKEGSKEWQAHCWDRAREVYEALDAASGGEALVDDRHELTIGKRLLMADRIGYPLIVICGKSSLEGKYEVYRGSPKPELMTLDQITREEEELRRESMISI